MSRGWSHQWHSKTMYDPPHATCAFCHRRPAEETTNISSSSDIAIGRQRYWRSRAYNGVPVCKRCAQLYRVNRFISRFFSTVLGCGVVGWVLLLILSEELRLVSLPAGFPFERALVVLGGLAIVDMMHYAICLFPCMGRVEEWLRNPRLQGKA